MPPICFGGIFLPDNPPGYFCLLSPPLLLSLLPQAALHFRRPNRPTRPTGLTRPTAPPSAAKHTLSGYPALRCPHAAKVLPALSAPQNQLIGLICLISLIFCAAHCGIASRNSYLVLCLPAPVLTRSRVEQLFCRKFAIFCLKTLDKTK